MYTTAYPETRLRDFTFYLHDHLGNMRVTYTTACSDWDNIPTSQRTQRLEHAVDYYPYGSILRQYVNGRQEKYLSTHHERDQETGLDYRGARYYDSDLARFLSLDPLAAKFAGWSPYNFVLGNPIMYVDPDGKKPDIVIYGENNSSLIIKTDMIDVSVDASALGIDFGGNYTLSGNDFLITGLDIVGMVDPTPISDGLSATLSFERGDWLGGGASLLGAAFPFAGDLAKLPKIAKGMDRISDAIKSQKKFGGGADTFSGSTREAFRKAKDQNGIPRSQQPDATSTVPEKGTGKPLREFGFTNSKGDKVSIRKDNPKTYSDGGKQGNHFNAGSSNDKLRQHHNAE